MKRERREQGRKDRDEVVRERAEARERTRYRSGMRERECRKEGRTGERME